MAQFFPALDHQVVRDRRVAEAATAIADIFPLIQRIAPLKA